ncbi:hypothetical protein [Sphingomonas asaccharolytica]|nr:hypothetical protein [Sphingomonas asaccharolytica]
MTKDVDVGTEHETNQIKRDWVKPEVVSFNAVLATKAATLNPGDALSSNS